jgi:hypothetical protein
MSFSTDEVKNLSSCGFKWLLYFQILKNHSIKIVNMRPGLMMF